jgi:SAM-dependent methyltransferase
MLREQAEQFRDPVSGEPMRLEVSVEKEGCIVEGAFSRSGRVYPIVRGVPRFSPRENYAQSFGFQWQTYSTTQLDSKAMWSHVSERRLFDDTGWSTHLGGQRILEAGSGMGRFTEILAPTGATIATFDYSPAVDANFANNGLFENISFAQADIMSPPFEIGSFDKVLCIGVVQHTPSPRKAFASLVRFLKPGGEIFIDCYRLHWKSLFRGKYYVRPITRHLPADVLHRLIELHVGWLFPLTGRLHDLIGPKAAKLSWALAMADYRDRFDVDEKVAREYTMLDTFDMLAPKFDRPQTIAQVRSWFESEQLVDIDVRPGSNGIVARGRRPL